MGDGVRDRLNAIGGRILGMLALRECDSAQDSARDNAQWVSFDELARDLAVDRQVLCDAIALQVAQGKLTTRGEWVRSSCPGGGTRIG